MNSFKKNIRTIIGPNGGIGGVRVEYEERRDPLCYDNSKPYLLVRYASDGSTISLDRASTMEEAESKAWRMG